MILAKLEDIVNYESLHPCFKAAVQALKNFRNDFDAVPMGKSPLKETGCFCIKVEGAGRGKSSSPLEAHRAFIDMQYTVEGTDIIGWKRKEEADSSSGYDEQKDIEFFPDCKVDTWFDVSKGLIAVFFPDDLHAPMACENEVKKLVIKIPVI